MNIPLGTSVGNALEVLEAIDILKGKEQDNNLVELSVELASEMISMGLEISNKKEKNLVIQAIDSGKAYKKFLELVERQGGDIKGLTASSNKVVIKSNKKGTITKINALGVGRLALELGAGRVRKTDRIDYTVGVKLNKLVNDKVKKGEELMTLYIGKKNADVNIDEIFTIE